MRPLVLQALTRIPEGRRETPFREASGVVRERVLPGPVLGDTGGLKTTFEAYTLTVIVHEPGAIKPGKEDRVGDGVPDIYLRVSHGRGVEEYQVYGMPLGYAIRELIDLPADALYGIFFALWSAHVAAYEAAARHRDSAWGHALVEDRVSVRKVRGRDLYRVSVQQLPPGPGIAVPCDQNRQIVGGTFAPRKEAA